MNFLSDNNRVSRCKDRVDFRRKQKIDTDFFLIQSILLFTLTETICRFAF